MLIAEPPFLQKLETYLCEKIWLCRQRLPSDARPYRLTETD